MSVTEEKTVTDRLPILVSVPHAGLEVPESVKHINLLTEDQIRVDIDAGASEIYDFCEEVACFLKPQIARPFVDLNRSPNDFGPDGVVKTVTCQMEQVYSETLSREIIRDLLDLYYFPWHQKISAASLTKNILFGVDCHTMLERAPGISADAGAKRPKVCLSNAGNTCPKEWLVILAELFEKKFGIGSVGINDPFKGGYIIRKHSKAIDWFQLELSREPFCSTREKKEVVVDVLNSFIDCL